MHKGSTEFREYKSSYGAKIRPFERDTIHRLFQVCVHKGSYIEIRTFVHFLQVLPKIKPVENQSILNFYYNPELQTRWKGPMGCIDSA